MIHKLNNPLTQCNLKFDSEADSGLFEGYASIFNGNDAVKDTILKGAFSEAEGEIFPLFVNHVHLDIPVGKVTGKEDDNGFYIQGDINLKHVNGPSLYSALKRQDLKGLSIGFTMTRDDYETKSGGGRIIKKATLKEVSAATFQCDPMALVHNVKSMAELEGVRDLEHFFRDEFGVSKSQATTIVSHCKRVFSGELINAEQQIEDLTRRLSLKNTVASLKSALESIGEKL